MKKNNPTGSGQISKVRGYSPIKTDFVEACQPDRRTSLAQKEDMRIYWFAILMASVLLVVMLINTRITENKLNASESVLAVSSEIILPTPTEAIKTVVPLKTEISAQVSEIYTVTAYCPCFTCCGKNDGITFSHKKAVEGVTLSADPNVLPMGTVVEIEGVGRRTVQDIGGAVKGKHIELFFNKHEDAENWGKKPRRVTVVEVAK